MAWLVEELNRYLTPLPLDATHPILRSGEKWEGWEFGRDLFVAEVISLIQQIPMVKYVLDVELLVREVVPVEENSMFDDDTPRPLEKVDKVLLVPENGLLCSLEHEINTVSTQEMYENGSPE